MVKLLTVGGYGIWWLVDMLMTLSGAQRDVNGRRLAGYERHKKTMWIVIGALFGLTMVWYAVSLIVAASFTPEGPTWFGWMLLALLVAAGIVVGLVFVLRARARRKAAEAARAAEPVPASIRARLDELAALRPLYAARSDAAAASIVDKTDALTATVPELFRRLHVRADVLQRGLAQTEYVDKLGKLIEALGPDYLLDVLANPRLWDDAAQRVQNVQAAMDALDAQLVENIRQVNARRGMVFQVALDGLFGPRKAMDDWQRDFDQASGDEH